VTNGANLSLGTAFNTAGAHDLVFRYGTITSGVNSADFDLDGDLDGADFLLWQRGVGTTDATRADGDADGDPDGPNQPELADVDAADLAIWQAGVFRPQRPLIQGFIRYVSGASAGVPEPGGVILAGLGVCAIAAGNRRKRNAG
jgi:hypothetical protein